MDKGNDKKKAKMALVGILSMEKRLPEDFDLQKELNMARDEKYSDFDLEQDMT